ncbi:mdj1 protein precursor, partial [Dimargaris xerosporica]
RIALAAKEDYYKLLGVGKNANQNEIKKAYYKLAKQYHPDTNKSEDARQKFVEIQEAYETLSDEQKRASYDQFGHNAFDGQGSPFGAGGFPGSNGGEGFPGGFDASDLFSHIFGGGAGMGGAGGRASRRGARTMERGENIEVAATISFMDAVKGMKKTISISPIVNCGTCHGSGMKGKAKPAKCTNCHGTGQETFMIQAGFQMASTCRFCHGTGTTVRKSDQCGTCEGAGCIRERQTVEVDIPAGIDQGMRIRVPGKGNAPLDREPGDTRTGPSGDLFVVINISPSSVFTRQGSDIFTTVSVPMHVALLGGYIRVPTINGDVEMKLPKDIQPGDKTVLRGLGAPRLKGTNKGNQYVKIQVKLPSAPLSPKQQEALETFAVEEERRHPTQAWRRSAASPASEPHSAASSTSSKSNTSSTSNCADKKGGFFRSTLDRLKHQFDKENAQEDSSPKDSKSSGRTTSSDS